MTDAVMTRWKDCYLASNEPPCWIIHTPYILRTSRLKGRSLGWEPTLPRTYVSRMQLDKLTPCGRRAGWSGCPPRPAPGNLDGCAWLVPDLGFGLGSRFWDHITSDVTRRLLGVGVGTR